MHDLKWSPAEKKLARAAYEEALGIALAKVMAEFKARASAVANPSDMWQLEDYLRERRREIEDMFDYRYSRLPLVFAGLVREGYLDESRLAGLSEEKRNLVRSYLSFAEKSAR